MKDRLPTLEQFLSEQINELRLYHGSPWEFDKFDISKVKTGDGLNKFGWGLYFADIPDTAEYYARELSIGDRKKEGFNVYTVDIRTDRFYEWEMPMPQHIFDAVLKNLRRINKESDAEEMEQDFEEYQEMWSIRNLYEWLQAILKDDREVSEFLYRSGVDGVIAKSPAHNGKVYVSFTDDGIRMIDHEKLDS